MAANDIAAFPCESFLPLAYYNHSHYQQLFYSILSKTKRSLNPNIKQIYLSLVRHDLGVNVLGSEFVIFRSTEPSFPETFSKFRERLSAVPRAEMSICLRHNFDFARHLSAHPELEL